ncbi:MAG: YcjF family protein [Gloeomargaritaceae cyanobacterium C42_A2020_066]|nr:YcjF family protein [Gloeomargaritaceae cyanobacterium C42_A2020_066]
MGWVSVWGWAREQVQRRPAVAVGLAASAWIGGDWLLGRSPWAWWELAAGLAGLGVIVSLRRPASVPTPLTVEPTELEESQVRQTLATLTAELDRLEHDLGHPQTVLREKWAGLNRALIVSGVQIHCAGQAGSGGAAIGATLASQGYALVSDASSLADLKLWVTAEDLTASDLAILQAWHATAQPVWVVWNRPADLSASDEQQILQRLYRHLRGFDHATCLVTVLPPIGHVKSGPRLLHQALADLSPQHCLTWRYAQVLAAGRSLQTEIAQVHNTYRRQRALALVERYQWLAAGIAFASPLPVIDLVMTGSLGIQLVQELATLYEAPRSLAQARQVMITLAPALAQLGLVEVVTQTVGPLLKSHGLTYALGGAMQGAAAAVLVRVAGLSLIDWFSESAIRAPAAVSPPAGWQDRVHRTWQQHITTQFWQGFVPEWRQRLSLIPSAAE